MIKELFPGVYSIDGRLATKNLNPGERVYGEELVKIENVEYRLWNPYRSKLAAAILKGLKNMYILPGLCVLYLGAATGTTCSHVSDILGKEGAVYCIEISKRSMTQLVKVCEKRPNMLPILADAMNVEAYASEVGKCDIIYQDVSSPMQPEILLRNAKLLKPKGYAYVAIKSQSIDTAKKPERVYREFINAVNKEFEFIEGIDISPYSLLHMFAVFRKK